MAGRTVPPGRPSFEPPRYARPPSGPPPTGPPGNGGAGAPARRPYNPMHGLRTMFATVAAIGVAALAVWLPFREAQHEALQHYPSTGYVDVARGTTRTWHNTQWRLVSIRRIPWRYYTGAEHPPGNFARMRIVLHATLVGPMARANAMAANDYLAGSLTKPSFRYDLRDRDDRTWETIANAPDSEQWCCGRYRPAKGLDVEILADVPPNEVNDVMPVVKYDDSNDFNFTKTPSPREVVLRFLR